MTDHDGPEIKAQNCASLQLEEESPRMKDWQEPCGGVNTFGGPSMYNSPYACSIPAWDAEGSCLCDTEQLQAQATSKGLPCKMHTYPTEKRLSLHRVHARTHSPACGPSFIRDALLQGYSSKINQEKQLCAAPPVHPAPPQLFIFRV